MTDVKVKTNDGAWKNLALSIFKVGSIYTSTDSTSPAILFGGTWVSIENTMLIGAGSGYAAGSTGGSATTTIDAQNLPKHTHVVGAHSHGLNSHVHSVGAHVHGLNGHTHTYDKADGTTGSTTLTTNQIPSHSHNTSRAVMYDKGTWGHNASAATVRSGGNTEFDTPYDAGITGTVAAGGGQGHTHTVSTTSVNTGGNSGSTANSSAFNTGAASGSTADSPAFNTSDGDFSNTAMTTISPYYAVYMWRRTA